MSKLGAWNKKKLSGEWAKTLQKYLAKQQDEVPANWVRGEAALQKMGLAPNSSGQRNKLLGNMVQGGFLEKKNFRIFDGTGRRVTSITHYKISGKA